jgi:uncharacterized protein (TIGR02588 family)
MARKQQKAPHEPMLEWAAAGLGLVLTLWIVAVIGREALNHEAEQLPAIEVAVQRVAPTQTGFVVEFEAVNRSGGTAAAVAIEGALKAGEASVETSSAVLDYVPGHSRRTGGLFFTSDPRLHRIEVRALGYQMP